MSDQKVLLKRALGAIEDLEARLRRAESRAREPIAVVGLSCRFPGANGPDELWRLLHEGVDAVRPFPEERWAWAAAGPPRPGIAGGFVDGLDQFDPAFFGISPREAVTMDPQQRMFLEGAWLALEDAGIRPADLVNSATGVFVGVTTSDYGQLTRSTGQDVYVATGAALNAISGRTSFVLGLQGPCVAMDTACSSSLVAVHTACQSLRAGDCDMALAGGVNAIISPEPFELFSRWGMLAPDGRCKTFDAAADGFSRGEGCGVLVLKRLSDAVASGDRILALIRGSAVNQDGRSSGLSVPNGPAQAKVLRAALRNAGLGATDVDYVEAHGTGTVLGDPIEVEAIAAVYGEGRGSDRPLRIGSIKANIAHCESASGVAGLCKVILSLQHEEIPPHLHFHEPNPRIAWDEYPLEINVTPLAWPRGSAPRRAGVSSFGFTGTNAHVLLEEAPPVEARAAVRAPAFLLPVSARSASALQNQARAYAGVLAAHTDVLPEFSRAAATQRTHFALRHAVVARDGEDAAAALRAMTPAVPHESPAPRVAFLFSGQGAQRSGMGRELYESSPLARETLDRCDAICRGKLPVPLLDALFGTDPAVLRFTAVTQPALFALEYTLAQLWMSWGIRPVACLGHSLGEYVAACVAGALSLEEALDLVIERGRLMGGLPEGGAMAAVFAPADRVQPYIEPHRGEISLAGVNGPESITISGAADAIASVMTALAADGIEARPLDVSHAFHSPLMQPILEPLRAAAARVNWQAPKIPIAGNLHGRLTAPGETFTAEYWQRHAREPVQFMDGMNALRAAGCNTFIEIGPAATLLGLGRRMLPDAALRWLPSFAAEGEWRTLLRSAGTLWEHGLDLDWNAITGPYAARGMRIPGYAFDRRRYWVDVSAIRAVPPPSADAHPLLGAALALAGDDVRVWNSIVDLERLPWIADHCVQGTAIVPATAYVEIALAAAETVLGDAPVRLLDMVNEKPLLLGEHQRYALQTRISRGEAGWHFEVHSRRLGREGDRWTRHVSGRFEQCASSGEPALDIALLRQRCTDRVDGASFYARLGAKGNQWGPAFQAMAEVWRGNGEAVSRVAAPARIAGDLGHYRFHPALSDAAGHVLVATGDLDRSAAATGGALVGGGIREIRYYRAPGSGELWAHATRLVNAGESDNVVVGDVRVYDANGALVSETLGARLWYLRDTPAAGTDDLFYELAWIPSDEAVASASMPAQLPNRWLLLADRRGIASALAERLEREGRGVRLVGHGGDPVRDRGGNSFGAADWDALLGELPAGETIGIADLRATDEDSDGTTNPIDAVVGLSQLVQRLAVRGTDARIWIATAGAQAVQPSDACFQPGGATLWGFGRALATEHRELWGGLIDLDPRATADVSAAAIHRWLEGSPAERAVAQRGAGTFVPRIRQTSVPPVTQQTRFDGTCIVTGGLGGIGLAVAEWLVRNGCRSLVLVGRTLPPDNDRSDDVRWAPVRETVRRLRAAGATVRLEAVDVAEAGRVADLAARLRAEGVPPVRFIFHAAGTLQYGPIATSAPGMLVSVLAPKVVGAQNLIDAFATDVRQVVLFSSSASLLPSPLMAAYAGANAFLDSYAHALRARGVRATSINWGTWGEVGMATRFARDDGGAVLTGLRTLGTAEALHALEQVLAADVAQRGILRMNWREWQRLYPDFVRDPLFSEVVTPEAEASSGTDFSRVGDLAPDERRAAIAQFLAECVGGVLGISAAELDRGTSINRLGFDSLMALETKNRIESRIGLVIPVVRLLDGPSVTELAGELDALWERRVEPVDTAAAVAAVEGEI